MKAKSYIQIPEKSNSRVVAPAAALFEKKRRSEGPA
jgi:hypothetical protein